MFSTLHVTFVREDSNVDGSGVYDRKKEQGRMFAASLFVSLSLLLFVPFLITTSFVLISNNIVVESLVLSQKSHTRVCVYT